MRNYDKQYDHHEDDMVVTVQHWLEHCKNQGFTNWDGSGYWMKDGFISHEHEVFSSEPEDATHVVWYNK